MNASEWVTEWVGGKSSQRVLVPRMGKKEVSKERKLASMFLSFFPSSPSCICITVQCIHTGSNRGHGGSLYCNKEKEVLSSRSSDPDLKLIGADVTAT